MNAVIRIPSPRPGHTNGSISKRRCSNICPALPRLAQRPVALVDPYTQLFLRLILAIPPVGVVNDEWPYFTGT